MIEAQESKLIRDREEAKVLRDQKKLEALERSRARQADPAYFIRRTELNKKPEKEQAPEVIEAETTNESENDPESIEDLDFDPFKPSSSDRRRFKIFVKP